MKITASLSTPNLDHAISRLENKTPFYEAVGKYMIGSVMKNFESEGRPKKWLPLSAATIFAGAGYKRQKFEQRGGLTKGFARHLSGKRILIDRGHLRYSITNEVFPDKAVIGSNLKYARIHQKGGFAGRGRKVYIPARPYILLQDEDRTEIMNKLRFWVIPK